VTHAATIDPVDAQLAAYNARDVDALVACYQPDCTIDDGAGARLMTGHAEMQARYRALFDGSPNLHCVIVHRTRIGDYVIDEESIGGRLPGTEPELRRAVVIYRIDRASGLIAHVRFLRESG
jgi:hypothetical protein